MINFKRIEEDFPELYVDKTYRNIQLECGDVDLLNIYPTARDYRVQSMTYPLSDFGTNMSSQTMAEDDIYDFIKKHYVDLVRVKNFFENQFDYPTISQQLRDYGFYKEDDYFWGSRFDLELDEDSVMILYIPQLTDNAYALDYHLVIPKANIFIRGDSVEEVLRKLGEMADE